MAKAKVLESRYAFADPWLRLRSDTVLLPNGRLLSPCTIFEYPDWVDVIALTGERNVVLVDQYRHAVGQLRTEFPAGAVDEAEVPLAAIKRELLEETGYLASKIRPLCSFFTSPGVMDEKIYAFVATGLEKQKQQLEEGEEIEVVEVTLETAMDMIRMGQIQDAKTIVALMMYERFFQKA